MFGLSVGPSCGIYRRAARQRERFATTPNSVKKTFCHDAVPDGLDTEINRVKLHICSWTSFCPNPPSSGLPSRSLSASIQPSVEACSHSERHLALEREYFRVSVWRFTGPRARKARNCHVLVELSALHTVLTGSVAKNASEYMGAEIELTNAQHSNREVTSHDIHSPITDSLGHKGHHRQISDSILIPCWNSLCKRCRSRPSSNTGLYYTIGMLKIPMTYNRKAPIGTNAAAALDHA